MISDEAWYQVENGKLNYVPYENAPDEYRGKQLPGFTSEDGLTALLRDYPDLIEEEAFVLRADPEGKGWADVSGVTKEGRLFVVEVKKGTINASSLGQAFGYAVYAHRWPKHMMIKEADANPERVALFNSRMKTGSETGEFPMVVVVGNNVSGTLLEFARFLQNGIQHLDISILSVGVLTIENSMWVCRRAHLPEQDEIPKWDQWKPGDLAQNIEWLDTKWVEMPVYVVGYADDGQIIIRRTRMKKNGEYIPFEESMTVPFLAHHKRIR